MNTNKSIYFCKLRPIYYSKVLNKVNVAITNKWCNANKKSQEYELGSC